MFNRILFALMLGAATIVGCSDDKDLNKDLKPIDPNVKGIKPASDGDGKGAGTNDKPNKGDVGQGVLK